MSELNRILYYREDIERELQVAHLYQRADKDILVVVHNQLPYLKACVESIRRETENYTLHVWDNASDGETKDWLARQSDVRVYESSENLGFIIPNNEMAKACRCPYMVLLNSDTVVRRGWDHALIGHLQAGYGQVGYLGGYLDSQGHGVRGGYGDDVDYIPGWCFAISRETYLRFGLFDQDHLRFAYGEDSDFSLRLKEAGIAVRALHLNLVHHFENKTILEVAKVRDCHKSYSDNHLYIKARWESYLVGKTPGGADRPNSEADSDLQRP